MEAAPFWSTAIHELPGSGSRGARAAMSEGKGGGGGRGGVRKKVREAACNAVAGGSAGNWFCSPRLGFGRGWLGVWLVVWVLIFLVGWSRRGDLGDGAVSAGRDQDTAAGVRPPFQPLLRRRATR